MTFTVFAPIGLRRLPGLDVGVVVALYPSDPAYTIEIQRAPDSAGAPNTGAAASIVAGLPGTQETYVDVLPPDGVQRWYRIRHTGNGDTASSWTDWRAAKPAQLPATLVRPAPIRPAFREVSTDDGTTGTLTLTVLDPQSRVTGGTYNRQAGLGTRTTGHTPSISGSTWTMTVTLAEGVTSSIWYQINGYDESGVLQSPLLEHVVTYRDSTMPDVADVTPVFDPATGDFALRLSGDEKTVSFRFATSTSSMPSDFDATSGTVASNRVVTTGTLHTLTALGDKVFAKVVAYPAAGGTGTPSAIVPFEFTWQNKTISKQVFYSAGSFLDASTTTTAGYTWSGGSLVPKNADAVGDPVQDFVCMVPQAQECILTGFDVDVYSNGGTSGTVYLYRVDSSGGMTQLVSHGISLNLGWQTVGGTCSDGTTGSRYLVFWSSSNNGVPGNTALAGYSITTYVPTLESSL